MYTAQGHAGDGGRLQGNARGREIDRGSCLVGPFGGHHVDWDHRLIGYSVVIDCVVIGWALLRVSSSVLN